LTAGSDIDVSDEVKILGVTFDSTLSMDRHVVNTVKNCNFHLQALRHLRPSITRDVAKTMACSIVSSRIDYCNSLLTGTSLKNISKLQRVQNRAARIVCNVARRGSCSSQLLRDLHWLPVGRRIEYKTAILCYKAHILSEPPYLSDTVRSYAPSRTLRSATGHLLLVPRCNTKVGARRFSVAAPKLWNALPESLRKMNNLQSFKAALKTHLFPIVTE